MAFSNISKEKAEQIISENNDLTILDVRTPEEFQQGHIKGAINIDIYSQTFKQELEKLDREKPYLIYCRSGNRSLEAMKLMYVLGFKEVFNLADGHSN